MKVPACDSVIEISGQVLTCTGNWSVIEVSTSLSPFDPATLDPAIIAQALGAGLIVPSVILLTVIPARIILNLIKGC
ncbi:MAG: hypothetical protein Q8S52_18655 [Methylobacter sp.]|nr:hypothetical protein [Methylobacter sp.]MDP2427722.1 hypothetical protein [Methylobacter sp.]MDP3364135.1 hypothetical protein [Methylobacter sp.]